MLNETLKNDGHSEETAGKENRPDPESVEEVKNSTVSDEKRVEEYNREAKRSQYNSYRFAGETKKAPVTKVPVSKKRKVGAAAAVIGGILFAGVMCVVLINGIRMAYTSFRFETKPFIEERGAEEPPSFEGHAGLPDMPEEQPGGDFDESAPGLFDEPAPEINEPSFSPSVRDDSTMSIADVAEQCMPSMVVITTTTVQEMQSFFGNGTETYEGEASGTGIIYEKTDGELMIVTNNHVVADSETISVGFVDDTVVPAELIGRDVAEDLAVLSVSLDNISSETLGAIRVIETGDSDDCRVGEYVVAIGNALGYGQSVSAGIISALNREVVVDGVNHTLIQTDAAINPGNSGGALLNMNGQLIGINEVKYAETTVEGMGYAIPIAKARPIISRLMNRDVREKVPEEDRSYLGVVCVTIPDSYVRQGYPSGVYISEVTKDQAADKAGIKEGDIVSAIDGYSVTTADELVNELEYYSKGSTVKLTVLRLDENKQQEGYRSMEVEVTLGSRAEADLEADNKEESGDGQEKEDSGTIPEDNGGNDNNNGGNDNNNGGQNEFPFNDWQDFFNLPFFR